MGEIRTEPRAAERFQPPSAARLYFEAPAAATASISDVMEGRHPSSKRTGAIVQLGREARVAVPVNRSATRLSCPRG
jgi:hypothetical protein